MSEPVLKLYTNPNPQVLEFPVEERKMVRSEWLAQGVHPADQAQIEMESKKATGSLTSVDEADTMVQYFLEHNQFRDALMFVVACNTGLRISDVLWIRWKDIEANEYVLKSQKTNKTQRVVWNEAVKAALKLYQVHCFRDHMPDDYVFVSEGPHKGHTPIGARKTGCTVQLEQVQPLRVETASRLVTKAAKATGLYRKDRRVSTHTARKTALNAIANCVDGVEISNKVQSRVLGVWTAQMMAGHSNVSTTAKHYLTDNIVLAAASELNLGLNAILAYQERSASE